MVDFVLDDLGGPAFKGFDPGLEFFRLPTDFDLMEAPALPGSAQQGEAAFLGFVRPVGFEDLRIEHGGIAAAVLKYDDPLRHADHIGGHTHAAFLMVQQSIHQIPGGVQVAGRCRGGLSGQEEGVVDEFSNHVRSPFFRKNKSGP